MLLAALLSMSMTSSKPDWSTLRYACDDTVVIARIENGAYQSIDDDDDILGHGVTSAKAHVLQIIQGSPAFHFDFRYISHASYIENQDFLLVLQHLNDRSMWLRSATLADDKYFIDHVQPVLADHCQKPGAVTE